MMSSISILLDDDILQTLEAEAHARMAPDSPYLRPIFIEAALSLRRERIRAQSRAVGEYVAATPEAAAFYREWGTPGAEGK